MLINNTTSRLKKEMIDLMRQLNSGLHCVMRFIFPCYKPATILVIDIIVQV